MSSRISAPADHAGGNFFRVVFVPGTDTLRAQCHCGAQHESDDPIETWDWLETHRHGNSA